MSSPSYERSFPGNRDGNGEMIQAKGWVLITGLVVAFLGYECLPHGQDLDAHNNTSLFAQSSSGGAFLSFGGITLAVGILIVVLSFCLPRR